MTKPSTATFATSVVSPVISQDNQLQSTANLAKLQKQMLAAETYNQMLALIVDYSHQEMQLAYSLLSPAQQNRIEAIRARDSLI